MLKLAWQPWLRIILVESDNMTVVHVLNDTKPDFSALSLARSIKGIPSVPKKMTPSLDGMIFYATLFCVSSGEQS